VAWCGRYRLPWRCGFPSPGARDEAAWRLLAAGQALCGCAGVSATLGAEELRTLGAQLLAVPFAAADEAFDPAGLGGGDPAAFARHRHGGGGGGGGSGGGGSGCEDGSGGGGGGGGHFTAADRRRVAFAAGQAGVDPLLCLLALGGAVRAADLAAAAGRGKGWLVAQVASSSPALAPSPASRVSAAATAAAEAARGSAGSANSVAGSAAGSAAAGKAGAAKRGSATGGATGGAAGSGGGSGAPGWEGKESCYEEEAEAERVLSELDAGALVSAPELDQRLVSLPPFTHLVTVRACPFLLLWFILLLLMIMMILI